MSFKYLLLLVCIFPIAWAAQIPSEWLDREAQYQLLLSTETPAKLQPFVGNGYIATTIDSDSIYINGVYNGPAGTTHPSHRARIPNFIRVSLSESSGAPLQFFASALDIQRGVYERIWASPTSNAQILERIYAHRTRRGLLVSTLTFQFVTQPWNVTWITNPGAQSPDITFAPQLDVGDIDLMCGSTIAAETDGAPLTRVCFASSSQSGSLMGTSNQIVTRLFYTTTSLDSDAEKTDAIIGLKEALSQDSSVLLQEHEAAWAQLWSSGIEVSSEKSLPQIINSTLYFLLSSARSDYPWSYSPGSLSSNSYNGHVFWDTETWMLPAMTVLHRDIASAILRYRNLRKTGANQKAALNGYDGYQFPWESAQLGVEVTPTDADTGIYEQHISSDIVLAIKQYWHLSKDIKWLTEFSDLVFGVADFWASRVTARGDGSYGINGVTGPDEYAVNVNNSVYTNVAAKMSLEFAAHVAIRLNMSMPNQRRWLDVATHMYIPFDEKLSIHPEFDGYNGQKIKQADVVLLGYPLGLPMADSVRLNDVKYYSARTDVDGPCMTDGIHTIALLDLGLPDAAAEFWPKSFANAQPPFWVWQETPTGGAINFITGAGGFLQAVLFGYGGLRVESKGLRFEPQLPPNTTTMKLRGVNYLDTQLDVFWTQNQVTLSSWKSSKSTLNVIVGTAPVQRLLPGQSVTFSTGIFTISK